jgi:glycosyltransferase involved in cell wall biosynthesis
MTDSGTKAAASMPRHVVFVTPELSPFTVGGAGVLISELAGRIREAGGTTTILLVAEDPGSIPDWVRLVPYADDPLTRAKNVAEAIAGIEVRIDVVEIVDFDGLGFWVLSHRAEAGVERVPVQIRFHGTTDLMFEAVGATFEHLEMVRTLERNAMAMADGVVAPSPAIKNHIIERYGLDRDRVTVGPPPIRSISGAEPKPSHSIDTQGRTIVCVARLSEIKGTDTLVKAAIPLLKKYPDVEIDLIGEDGWSATTDQPMSVWLTESLIPLNHAHRIRLVGRLEGGELTRRIRNAYVAVVPSRSESFNLALHEIRSVGIPVVVNDLPAFEGFDESDGVVKFDGTVKGLTNTLSEMLDKPDQRAGLASKAWPTQGDPLDPYRSLPRPRHTREQGGRGTIAVKELEDTQSALLDAGIHPERGLGRRIAAKALVVLPEGVARRVVNTLPNSLVEDRLYVADWQYAISRKPAPTVEVPDESDPVIDDRAIDRLMAHMLGPCDDPLVSVVVPCYNQGDFINDAIRSVFEQTFTSFEVIVVDDGSDDRTTARTLDDLVWTRTTLIRQANRGLAAARNAGIERARGAFIVPLDADDKLHPEFLERTLQALADDPDAPFATCRARLFGDIDAVYVPRPFNRYQLLLSNSIVGCVLMRASAVKGAGGYTEQLRSGNEDWDLWIRLTADASPAELDDVLFFYRKHGISMSATTEARFEQARSEIAQLHRSVYEPDSLARLKSAWYPLVSIVTDPDSAASLEDQTLEDVQVIVVGSDAPSVDDAVRASVGKFIIRWEATADTTGTELTELAMALEADGSLGEVHTQSSMPLVMVRRWSLHDPDGPTGVVVVPIAGSGANPLEAGSMPDESWSVPADIDGVPAQRQHPETSGMFPDWIPV